MKDNLDFTRGWLLKGDSDLADARRTVTSEGPYDTACFHAQQAVEKYLKAVLAYRRQPIPRTHDLEELVKMCAVVESSADLGALELEELTGYAVELRYDPEFWPSQGTAAEAVALADRVRAIVYALLPKDVDH